ncbi:MAG: PmoA family protein [Bacteroidetes bacterium]|nr:PmoA family protein [Bacteroidota bacterium]
MKIPHSLFEIYYFLKSMKRKLTFWLAFIIIAIFFSIQPTPMMAQKPKKGVKFVNQPENKRIEVWIDGQFFTAYIYPENIAKPVLYPLITTSGKKLTRGYPLDTIPGERIDHPHHVGYWLNYGDVNGLDFWNNSLRHSQDKNDRYGTIYHYEVNEIEPGKKRGKLTVSAVWEDHDGDDLLIEKTEFTFSQKGNTRIIDRITTLTAQSEEVRFTDNKEGMVAVRVARALELPEEKPAFLIGKDGNPTPEKVLDNTDVKGNYLSSEGIEGGDVWGTRARWMKLYSEMDGEKVALALIDHPKNPGYPTYWHARTYGLFSANPLGQKVFSKGAEELNFKLAPGESVVFRYRLLVHDGDGLGKGELDDWADEWAGGK